MRRNREVSRRYNVKPKHFGTCKQAQMTSSKNENPTPQRGHWPLPEDLETLHDSIIEYAVRVHGAATKKHERAPRGPLSHVALSTLHRSAIVIHRAVRTLCVAGWTPTSPIMIRTLLDVLASSYAVAFKIEDAEYMGFKFMCSSLIQAARNPDRSEAQRTNDKQQLDAMRQQLQRKDLERVDEFIKNYKPQLYWFQPEFKNPSKIIGLAKSDLLFMYRQFSGSAHGGFIGSLLFSDSPDTPDINAQEHPGRTRHAVLISSRLLLDISYIRGHVEEVTDENEYRHLVKTLILPFKPSVTRRTGSA